MMNTANAIMRKNSQRSELILFELFHWLDNIDADDDHEQSESEHEPKEFEPNMAEESIADFKHNNFLEEIEEWIIQDSRNG